MTSMKKFLLALFVVALPLGMVACSDDDDDDANDPTLADVAAATYEGEFSAMAGLAKGDITTTLSKVTGKDDVVSMQIGTIEIETPALNITIGKIDEVKLTGTAANVTIAEQTFETTLDGLSEQTPAATAEAGDGEGDDDNGDEEVLKVKVTISGSVKDGKLLLTAKNFEITEGEAPNYEEILKTLSVSIDADKKK